MTHGKLQVGKERYGSIAWYVRNNIAKVLQWHAGLTMWPSKYLRLCQRCQQRCGMVVSTPRVSADHLAQLMMRQGQQGGDYVVLT